MVIRSYETDIAVGVRFRKSGIFQLAQIALPIVIFLFVLCLTLSLVMMAPQLMLVAAVLMLAMPPLIYFRLAYIDTPPKMTLNEWMRNPGANLALAMGSSAVAVMMTAEKRAAKNNAPLTPFWLLYGFIEEMEGKELLIRLGLFLNETNLTNLLNSAREDSSQVENTFLKSVEYANAQGGKYLEIEDFLVGLWQCDELFNKLLVSVGIDEKAIYDVVSWHKRIRKECYQPPFWEKPVIGGVGQDWAYGYTPMLQQFASSLTNEAQFAAAHIELFSRSSYVESMEQLLAKSGQNNVLLVGDYGVGKKTMVMALAQKIVSGNIHPALRYKQVMQVNVGALLAGSQTQGDIVQRIEILLYEAARAGNIILFFEDFHALVSSDQNVGSINAAEVILPYLQSSVLQVIGSTTVERYHLDIERAAGILNVFEKVDIPEPSEEESLKMLEESLPMIENKYGVLFIYQALKEIVNLSERYIHDKPFPQKALDLASEVGVKLATTKNRVATDKDVQEVVSMKTHVPVGNVETQEKDRLLNLENILHQRVIGQNEAVVAVSNAMRRARSGLSSGKRPIGTFLFIGPTGVGKTEMAKALAEAYFGDEKRMIRFDMSEYQDEASIYNLIGAPAGPGSEGTPGLLTSAIHDNPFSLILLDELEKAHPNLLTLFLQVFDDGRLTSGNGKTVDFTNSIIIATSNAGSEIVRQYLASGKNDVEELKTNLMNYLQEQGIYRPEFLNRFDGVIAFRPLEISEVAQIAQLMINGLNQQLAEKGLAVNVSEEALDYLVQKGYDPVFGARPMRRVIQENLENVLAKKMLSTQFDRGTVIEIGMADLNGGVVR